MDAGSGVVPWAKKELGLFCYTVNELIQGTKNRYKRTVWGERVYVLGCSHAKCPNDRESSDVCFGSGCESSVETLVVVGLLAAWRLES